MIRITSTMTKADIAAAVIRDIAKSQCEHLTQMFTQDYLESLADRCLQWEDTSFIRREIELAEMVFCL